MNPPTRSHRGQSDRFGEPGKRPQGSSVGAFTIVELVVVLAVLALGAMLLAPALARTQPDSRAARCLNNHRQLCRAWLMYASDNNDKLAARRSGGPPPGTWLLIPGLMDWSLSPDNTNTIYLTDSRYSILAMYCGKDARLFKCPADQYLTPAQRAHGWKERARSFSQNVFVGENNPMPLDPAYTVVKKLAELLNPKPAETWVSIDEHPDSINDGAFYAPTTAAWIDLPANYHDGGAGVAFADGHSEIHRWEASLLKVGVKFAFSPLPMTANDLDMRWLRYHTPRRLGAN